MNRSVSSSTRRRATTSCLALPLPKLATESPPSLFVPEYWTSLVQSRAFRTPAGHETSSPALAPGWDPPHEATSTPSDEARVQTNETERERAMAVLNTSLRRAATGAGRKTWTWPRRERFTPAWGRFQLMVTDFVTLTG